MSIDRCILVALLVLAACGDKDPDTGEPHDADTATGADTGPVTSGDTTADADLDGYPSGEDCNDSDASINPDADEVCNDGVDNDCDGSSDCDDGDCAELCGGKKKDDPCNPTLPKDTTTATAGLDTVSVPVFACSGSMVWSYGGSSIFSAAGSWIEINGEKSVLYIQAGAQAIINNGGNTVVQESGAMIGYGAGVDPATIEIVDCPALEFDFSLFSPACE